MVFIRKLLYIFRNGYGFLKKVILFVSFQFQNKEFIF